MRTVVSTNVQACTTPFTVCAPRHPSTESRGRLKTDGPVPPQLFRVRQDPVLEPDPDPMTHWDLSSHRTRIRQRSARNHETSVWYTWDHSTHRNCRPDHRPCATGLPVKTGHRTTDLGPPRSMSTTAGEDHSRGVGSVLDRRTQKGFPVEPNRSPPAVRVQTPNSKRDRKILFTGCCDSSVDPPGTVQLRVTRRPVRT